jgi:hypothetical protein
MQYRDALVIHDVEDMSKRLWMKVLGIDVVLAVRLGLGVAKAMPEHALEVPRRCAEDTRYWNSSSSSGFEASSGSSESATALPLPFERTVGAASLGDDGIWNAGNSYLGYQR